MLDPDRVNDYFERGIIEVAPLAFMRGRTLNDSFVILDEAQNTSPEQMKMFLTRLGFGSKMVVTGDVTQIDLPANQRSGLVVVGEILSAVEDISFIRFGGDDVVRHRLVQRIVAAYGEYGERARPHDAGTIANPGGRDRVSADLADVPPELAEATAAALEAAGRLRGPPLGRARRRGADPRAQPRAPRAGRADRRALVPARRSRPERRAARARRRA